MKNLSLKFVGLLLVGLVFGSNPAIAEVANPFAVQHPGQTSTHLLLAQVSIEKAIKKAKSKYGGKVLSAKEIRSKGPLVYKVKLLLPSGRVKTVFVDGETGEVFEA